MKGCSEAASLFPSPGRLALPPFCRILCPKSGKSSRVWEVEEMRKARWATALLLVSAAISGVLLASPFLVLSGQPTETPAKVALTDVTVGRFEQTLRVMGRVRGVTEAAALSPMDGLVAQVYVRAGDRVEAGQALLCLDDRAAASAMRAALENAEAAQTAAAWAEARVQADGAALADQVNGQADRQVLAASAALSALVVRSPVDGVVRQVMAAQHGGLTAGSPAVLISSEAQRVVCPMVLRDAAQVQAGMAARVLSGGEPVTMARVTEIAPASVDPATGQTVAEVTLLPDALPDLPLGAAVEAEIILCAREDAATVPSAAVTEESTVWWAEGGRAWEVPVTVLMDNGVDCWVDLPEGMRVVREAADLVQGQRIREAKR